MKQELDLEEQKPNKWMWILVALAIVCMAGILIFTVTHKKKDTDKADSSGTSKTEKWQEGVISYEGKYYKYNTYIKSYLVMGIDRSGPGEEV